MPLYSFTQRGSQEVSGKKNGFAKLQLGCNDTPLHASSVGTDGYDVQRNILAAVLDGGFDSVAQTTTARYAHAGNGDGTDPVMLKNERQLFGIINAVQLGTADHGHTLPHKIMVEIAIGKGGAIGSDQQVSTLKAGGLLKTPLPP